MTGSEKGTVSARAGSSLIEQFTRHRVAANLLMIMMLLVGAWGLRHIHTQLNPPQTQPEVEVVVLWPGASAEDVEARVTIPSSSPCARRRTCANSSSSVPGRAYVWVELNFDADRAASLDLVKQAVANIRNLPADIEPPQIRLQRENELVASVLVTGSGSLDELIPLAREFERDLLARGITEIQIDGLPEQQLRIMVDGRRLTESGESLGDLALEIRRLSADVPAGTVGRAQGPRALRSLDQQRSVRGFEGLYLNLGGDLVRLGDLADIEIASRDDAIEVARDGKPAIELYLLPHR